MADIKVSELTAVVAAQGTDLLLISEPDGSGGFVSKNMTLAQAALYTVPLTTKGDLLTYTTTPARLAVGTASQLLRVNSATASGLEWGPTLTKLSTGFSILDGTTARTLTVTADCTINQNLSTASSVTFGQSLFVGASAWYGLVVGGNGGGNRVVIGDYSGDVAAIGGHTAALTNWAHLYLQPQALATGARVGIGQSPATESANATLHSMGTTILGLSASALSDGSFYNSNIQPWLDEAGGQLKFKTKSSTGVVQTFAIGPSGSVLWEVVNTTYLRPSSGYVGINMFGDGSTSAPQLILSGVSDTTKQMSLGYDTANEKGFIQAQSGAGPTYRNLMLQPLGSNVAIGRATSYSPSYRLDVNGVVFNNSSIISEWDATATGQLRLGNAAQTGYFIAGFVNSSSSGIIRAVTGDGTASLKLAIVADTLTHTAAAATFSGTLGVTGATTLSSTLSAGASTLASAVITASATIGTTLGVTGATTLSSTLNVTGLTTYSSITGGRATIVMPASGGNIGAVIGAVDGGDERVVIGNYWGAHIGAHNSALSAWRVLYLQNEQQANTGIFMSRSGGQTANFPLHVGGAVCLGIRNSAPTDADIYPNQFVPWYDEGGGTFNFRIRSNSGTYFTKSL